MKSKCILLFIYIAAFSPSNTYAEIILTHAPEEASTYSIMEFEFRAETPDFENLFTDVRIRAQFSKQGDEPILVDGFCDSQDGSVFRLRFMPPKSGEYAYRIMAKTPDESNAFTGSFDVSDSGKRGVLRVDPNRSNHFIWEGTGEHYFWNGTTTYYLMGWQDDREIERIIDRLHEYKINRLRVLIYGRNNDRPWGQPVRSTDDFKLYLNPWPAAQPDNVKKPQFDLSRFNVEYWRKYERMLRYAQEKDIIVSVIFFIGGQVHPTPFEAYSDEERLFYRYGVARLAAFSNITWDLGNEHNFHREAPQWCDWLGPIIRDWDPYDHILSAHNVVYRTPGADWNDIQLIQHWDDGQNAFMLKQRELQAKTGRVIPNINEEYGYEDLWEKYPGHRKAVTRRRLAWEISMAGCYQTTGETAERGVGFSPDSGGGWVSGRGDDSMTMLAGYERMVDFFTAFDWWNYEPHNDFVRSAAYCLAKSNEHIVIYMPQPHPVTVNLKAGNYAAQWYNPRTGETFDLPVASGPVWCSPQPADDGDWVLKLDYDENLLDDAAPYISHISASGEGDRVYLTFSERLNAQSAQNVNNYDFDAPVKALSARLLDKDNVVLLSVRPNFKDGQYTLTVRGVSDIADPPNAIGKAIAKSFVYQDVSTPLIYFPFEEGKGATTKNLGVSKSQITSAIVSDERPQWTNNAAASGYALDFGEEPGDVFVDVGKNSLDALKELRSFTITGWINTRSNEVGPGGNRILCCVNNGGDGIDLVYLKDGSLQLGIDQWPDGSPARSSKNRIRFDKNTAEDNWTFFAVTYDSTLSSGHVKWYFGDLENESALDKTVSYDRGATGVNMASLTIGHFNPNTRANNKDRMFRGILDEIAVYGSDVDASGAFSLERIKECQYQ